MEKNLRDIFTQVTDKGPGGHVLNGPVYVEEAEPGDTLEVRIQKIDLALPCAYNGFAPNRGFLPEDFPYRKIKIISLDKDRKVAEFAPGIEIPLRPFFGSMGVAPPENYGRIDSAPPGIHAGNMDNKELVAGSTLYAPVHARGALFEIGDDHVARAMVKSTSRRSRHLLWAHSSSWCTKPLIRSIREQKRQSTTSAWRFTKSSIRRRGLQCVK